jgi:exonuclease III
MISPFVTDSWPTDDKSLLFLEGEEIWLLLNLSFTDPLREFITKERDFFSLWFYYAFCFRMLY